jgi:hypothetical protein
VPRRAGCFGAARAGLRAPSALDSDAAASRAPAQPTAAPARAPGEPLKVGDRGERGAPVQPAYAPASAPSASCSAARTPGGSVASAAKKRAATPASAASRRGARAASCPTAWYVKPRRPAAAASLPRVASATPGARSAHAFMYSKCFRCRHNKKFSRLQLQHPHSSKTTR